MDSILQLFGVVWPKLIAQIIIFLIVYFVLKRFAFGPVVEMLEKRHARIEEAEANLEKSREKLAGAEAEAAGIVAVANERSDSIVADAKEEAAQLAERRRGRATEEASDILARANEAGEIDRERLMGELRRDFSRLVAEATSKVSGKVLDPKDHARINQEAVAQIAA